MSITEEEQYQQHQTKDEKMNFSLSIWPPTHRTREAVIQRLVETLSTPSILSKRYGSLSPEEASNTARLIEEEAFSIASLSESNNDSSSSDDSGIQILQIYSKEIGKRMLDAVKSKTAASGNDNAAQTPMPAPTVTSEEISSLESESSQT